MNTVAGIDSVKILLDISQILNIVLVAVINETSTNIAMHVASGIEYRSWY